MITVKGSFHDGYWLLDKQKMIDACLEIAKLDSTGRFEILVCTPEEAISQRQYRWYKMTVRKLAEQTGDSQDHWEVILMTKAGSGLFEVEFKTDALGHVTAKRPSVKNLNKKDMAVFIENILSYSYERGLDIQPPDWNNRYK